MCEDRLSGKMQPDDTISINSFSTYADLPCGIYINFLVFLKRLFFRELLCRAPEVNFTESSKELDKCTFLLDHLIRNE